MQTHFRGTLLWAVVALLSLGGVARAAPSTEQAVFAGGCFWSMELAFHQVPGVLKVVPGYTGGTVQNPSYEQVSEGNTGHVEAVQVDFDPAVVSYGRLVDAFWHHVDPTDDHGQFCDQAPEYRSEIFYKGDAQQRVAEASKVALVSSHRLSKPVVTRVVAAGAFYPAESYHWDYARKNAVRYGMYRTGCGRDRRLADLWGKTEAAVTPAQPPVAPWKSAGYRTPDKAALKAKLTPAQYNITQEEGTESPFHNDFWNNHEPGLYVDVVSGEPLFSSTDKFESGTGWPSFTRPLDAASIHQKVDKSLFGTRTEIRSAKADSHLGHVFDDGPAPTGLRYCINSAALRFIPVAKLTQEGYGEYAKLYSSARK